MEIEKRHCNIVLQALAVRESNKAEDTSIRSIVPIAKLTERECELAASILISEGLLVDHEESISPKTNLKISEAGRELIDSLNADSSSEFGSALSVKNQISKIKEDKIEEKIQKQEDYETAFKTHLWRQTGSHAGGAGEITRDKWYPMGSFCRKCGIRTQVFKRKPTRCPK